MSTDSRKVAPQDIPPERPVSEQNDFNRSELSIISNPPKKAHLSESVKKSIAQIGQHNLAHTQPINKINREESQFTKLIRTKIKDLRRISVCDICSSQFKRTCLYLCDCEHKHSFCQSCLYAYALYKIKQFEEVYCPAQECGKVIDTNGNFFKQIPVNLQNTYHKIHRFSLAAKDSSVVKLCPNQQCQGSLRLKEDEGLICDTCKKQFCAKCYLAKHEGDCEQFQLNYFQNNLHYRQCRRCKMIVEKNKGCNHMTCRCHYQFCYICGQRWSTNHAKMHQQHSQEHHPQPRLHHHSLLLEMVECCICNECHQGVCAVFWNSYMGIVIKFIAKLLLLILQGVLLLAQLAFRDIPFLVWMLVCTLLIGMLFNSFQVICESECPYSLLLLVFFPVAMVIGIYRACGEVFEPAMQQFYNGAITPMIDSFNNIISF